MPRARVTIKEQFTKAAEQPRIPRRLSLHSEGLALFKVAQVGVSFTGCVDFTTGVVYLAPLKADEARGNVEIGPKTGISHHNSAGSLEGIPAPEHLFHPNLSPAGRALADQTSGHTKICLKYGLPQDNCIGFAVTKSEGGAFFTTNSRTLNTQKFRIPNPSINGTTGIVRQRLVANLGSETLPSDGELSREWASAIADAVELAFIHCVETPGGNFESPI